MRLRSIALLALVFALPAAAQEPPQQATNLEAITVQGQQPGPGLWKVTKNQHTMWILGLVAPLPRDIQWHSADVENAVANSQVVLQPPSMSLKPKVGWFGKLMLLPTLINARDQPDDGNLKDAVPADDYALWLKLKEEYIGKDKKIENYRPIFAALKLYNEAVKGIGLRQKTNIAGTVDDLAKTHGVEVQQVQYEVEIAEPRAAVKQFKASTLDDVKCFHQTLDNIDKRLGTLTVRANAWATGDVPALRKYLVQDRWDICLNTVAEAGIAKRLGISDMLTKLRTLWLSYAIQAITNHRQSFAMLPMEDLIDPNGSLSELRKRGYTVVAPDDDDATTPTNP